MTVKASITITARKDPKLDRALKGATDKASKISAKRKQDELRAAADEFRKKGTLSAGHVRVLQRHAREQVKIAQRTARARMAAVKREFQAEKREVAKAAKVRQDAARKVAAGRRAGLQRAGGAALGVGAGLISVAQRGRAVAGVRSEPERLAIAQQVKEGLASVASEARQGDRGASKLLTDALLKQTLELSKELQVDETAIVAGFSEAQSGFAQLDKFVSLMPSVVRAAKASAAPGEEAPVATFVKLFGIAGDAFNLTSEEMKQLGGVIKETSAEGSITPDAFANVFGPALIAFAESSQRRGLAGFREALAFGQVLGTAKEKDAASIATAMKTLSSVLNKADVREKLAKLGVQVGIGDEKAVDRAQKGRKRREDDFRGRILPIDQLFENFERQIEVVGKPGVLEEALGQQETATILTLALAAGSKKFREVESATGGEADIANVIEGRLGSEFGRAAQIGFDLQAATTQDSAKIIEAMIPLAGTLSELEARFPRLSLAMEVLTPAIIGLTGVIVAQKLLGGGGVGGAGKLLGGAGKALGGVAKFAGALGLAALPGLALNEVLKATGGDKALERGGAFLFSEKGAAAERTGPSSLAATRALGPGTGRAPAQEMKAALKIEVDDKRVRVTQVTADANVDLDIASGIQTFR